MIHHLIRDLRADLRDGPFQKLLAGVVCGAILTVYALSNATLLFGGRLEIHIALGMGITLVSALVMCVSAALSSSYAPTVSQVQEVPVAYIAAMVMTLPIAGEALLPTAVAQIGLATALMGVIFIIVGTFRLSRFIRFVPFPVLSGFLAVVGWFVCKGAMTIILGEPASLASLGQIAEEPIAIKLAAAILVAALVVWFGQRSARPLATPAVILTGILFFNIVVWIADVPTLALQETRWIARLPESARLWPPLQLDQVPLIDWALILGNLPTTAVLIGVAMMAMLMNVSGLEIQSRRDIDMNWELKAAGASNLIAGLSGGAPGYVALSNTLLSTALGGGTRLTTLTAGATLGAVVIAGATLLRLIPLPILAGVLLAIGFNVLRTRLIKSREVLTRPEHAVVLAIFAAAIVADLVAAVMLGTLCAMVLFIVEYSRQEVVKVALSGSDFQSQAETSDARRQLLEKHGDAILVLRLQGFLFFGSADRLKQEVERRLSEKPHLRFMILDFRRVAGLDSAAVQSFRRILDGARAAGVRLIFADVSPEALQILTRGGLSFSGSGSAVLAEDFDAALAACERSILETVDPALAESQPRPLSAQLLSLLGSEADAAELARAFERREFEAGMPIIQQGTNSEDIYLIEAGRARVCLSAGDETLTLATLGPGAFVGELSFYLGRPRSASVISEDGVIAWCLDRSRLAEIETRFPHIVARFHAAMASMLAGRVSATNRLLRFFAE